MGFVLVTMMSFLAGLLFLAGWGSLDAVCACVPITERVANGTLGLFCVGGAVLGAVLQITCG